jgi:membrane fusion protein, multidrug efflux system
MTAVTRRLLQVMCLGLQLAACGSAAAQNKGNAPQQRVGGGSQQSDSAKTQAQEPPPAVTVAPVVVNDVTPRQRFIGHVIPIQAVQIVARVTAFIDQVAVAQGSIVKPGQALFELQKAQYQAAVDAAKGQLASAKAALWQAQLTYQRIYELEQKNAETQADLDQAQANRDQNQASVQVAEANLEQAQLNLSYCTIASPIAGLIGAIKLTKGNLVTPTSSPLATVNQLDPVRVQFQVTDQFVVTAEQKSNKSVEQIAAGLPVQLVLPNGSTYDQTGKVAFVNNEVETQTGTVGVYADFPNPAGVLLPGAYVRVNVEPQHPEQRPLVPVAAIQMEQAEGIQKVHPDEVVNPVTQADQPQASGSSGSAGRQGKQQGG